jgi:hypothetical protein
VAIVRTDPYQEPLDAARREHQQLQDRRAVLRQELQQVEARLQGLEATIQALSQVTQFPPPPIDVALPELCETVLRNVKGALTAPQIRDYMLQMGYDISDYKNPMAVLHNTLRRMTQTSSVISYKNEEGQTVYRWSGPR